MGSLALELIQPDEHPNVWRKFLDEQGVQPIAFVVDNYYMVIFRIKRHKGLFVTPQDG